MDRSVAEPAEDETDPMFLTFSLGAEDYGIPLERVLEIIGMQAITPIPDTPAHVRGVINLRGKVIPVFDARARFGLPGKEYESRTCIIVVQAAGWSVGLVVDRVSEVIAIPDDLTEPPPPVTVATGEHYLAGLGKVGDRVRLLLDVDRFLAGQTRVAA
ncbi:MAG: chemotaxis protein CheW [Myxococcota bacterium]